MKGFFHVFMASGRGFAGGSAAVGQLAVLFVLFLASCVLCTGSQGKGSLDNPVTLGNRLARGCRGCAGNAPIIVQKMQGVHVSPSRAMNVACTIRVSKLRCPIKTRRTNGVVQLGPTAILRC